MGDASWRHWCQGDGVAQLQDHASFPPRSSLHVDREPQRLVRSHTKPVSQVPEGTKPVPYKNTAPYAEYIPPAHIRPRVATPDK
jgi:hypothetical protein